MKKTFLIACGLVLASFMVGCNGSSEPASPPAEDVAAKLTQDQKNIPESGKVDAAGAAIIAKGIGAGGKAPPPAGKK